MVIFSWSLFADTSFCGTIPALHLTVPAFGSQGVMEKIHTKF
jgi:hypothetical protein